MLEEQLPASWDESSTLVLVHESRQALPSMACQLAELAAAVARNSEGRLRSRATPPRTGAGRGLRPPAAPGSGRAAAPAAPVGGSGAAGEQRRQQRERQQRRGGRAA